MRACYKKLIYMSGYRPALFPCNVYVLRDKLALPVIEQQLKDDKTAKEQDFCFSSYHHHHQFTVNISLVVCGQMQEVNEIMRQMLIHGALNLERLGRHGTFKS